MLRIDRKTAAWRTTVCLLLALAAVSATGQSSSNELSAYTAAVARERPSERLVQLEHFGIDASPGPLKIDALEFVIWEFLRTHNAAHALTWANELANVDKDNPVAVAVFSERARTAVENGEMKPRQLLTMASHGLEKIQQLQRPLGMSVTDFAELRQQTYAMLSGAAGTAELEMKDYVAARTYLHNSMAVRPDNSRDVYPLALADLNGPDQRLKEGYWYLARAVDLSRGTPQGRDIAQFARARYVKDGGSTSDWNQFLASAAAAKSSTSTRNTLVASAAPPAAVASAPTRVAPPVKTASVKVPTVAEPPKLQPPNLQPAPSVWADTTPEPIIRKRVPVKTGPMSLGILVETSLANKGNRSAVVNSLIDMLRHMSDDDEAFILSYDNNLVFQQDLTTDPQQLEQALQEIKPQRGAVLDDAIAFAAGHLARIAKYPNRVLLVISDGRNVDSQTSPLQTSAEINAAGVRIFCIGLDVSEAYGRSRLQALSASTGGQSSFISDAEQFRKATREMAQNMGIDFRF